MLRETKSIYFLVNKQIETLQVRADFIPTFSHGTTFGLVELPSIYGHAHMPFEVQVLLDEVWPLPHHGQYIDERRVLMQALQE